VYLKRRCMSLIILVECVIHYHRPLEDHLLIIIIIIIIINLFILYSKRKQGLN
jgi:hypothetical protein